MKHDQTSMVVVPDKVEDLHRAHNSLGTTLDPNTQNLFAASRYLHRGGPSVANRSLHLFATGSQLCPVWQLC